MSPLKKLEIFAMSYPRVPVVLGGTLGAVLLDSLVAHSDTSDAVLEFHHYGFGFLIGAFLTYVSILGLRRRSDRQFEEIMGSVGIDVKRVRDTE
jgi:hypothetical protein